MVSGSWTIHIFWVAIMSYTEIDTCKHIMKQSFIFTWSLALSFSQLGFWGFAIFQASVV